MTILHLSDTHGKHHLLTNLPKADIIIHSGDFCFSGSEGEVEVFINWFRKLDYEHKIFIAGNHDNWLYDNYVGKLPDNCHYLHHSGVVINGIKFWGTPLFLEEMLFENPDDKIDLIPTDVNVLISHVPPHDILDYSGKVKWGSKYLLEKIRNLKPQYHLFGHIHDSYGIHKTEHTTFSNAAIVDEWYEMKNEPVLLQINR